MNYQAHKFQNAFNETMWTVTRDGERCTPRAWKTKRIAQLKADDWNQAEPVAKTSVKRGYDTVYIAI